MTKAPNFPDFIEHLENLGLFHMDLGLDRMAAFVARAGRPRFPVLHVVGTNGKGSTATILAELLRAHGLRVGLYTSPHFVSVRERILVDGALLSEETWARLGAEVLSRTEGLGLTYFELLTALAVLAFEDAKCDVAVMEAGLGGRYDATNVLAPALTVFTPIGLDHQNVLGNTLAEIALDKAGAMRTGGLAITAHQEPEAMAVLRRVAAEVGSELVSVGEVLSYSRAKGRVAPAPNGKVFAPHMTGLRLGLPGLHQQENARLALAAFTVWAARLRLPVIEAACRDAFAQAFIPGRMQHVPAGAGLPELILDGGHNAHGLAALKASLDADGIRPGAVVFGCLRDKPLDAMLPLVRSLTTGAVMAAGIPSCPRSCEPDELAGLLGPGAVPALDVNAALAALANCAGPVLVCGSLYLLGEFYTNHPGLLERPEHLRGKAASSPLEDLP
ncbi:MAG: Mur ligase family protein [Humidesulfovibrio sp.]|uniref:bifunctional folylpolyglutamate synthase/dihydrofolate synthase n=1 Tax=Humidesulfovibrio sp. TaxID=2910988 RepID=UPI0027FD0D91|nr:Mur ligase family protein [Humidesulfovibrio sp.]MDQ7834188.1 Mur ligase family protein [Humidesulfovibrio sp.]